MRALDAIRWPRVSSALLRSPSSRYRRVNRAFTIFEAASTPARRADYTPHNASVLRAGKYLGAYIAALNFGMSSGPVNFTN